MPLALSLTASGLRLLRPTQAARIAVPMPPVGGSETVLVTENAASIVTETAIQIITEVA